MVDHNKKQNISPAEWEIMRVVWAKGETTSKEVFNILNEKTDWKNTTVKTLLKRLVEKDMLTTEKVGNKFIYTPLVEQKKSVQNVTDDLLAKLCVTKVGNLIETIIADSDLSFDDIDRIEELLKEKRKTAVETVMCNCTPGQCKCSFED
ncbi:CopY/TcrY family copper transport repressor [Metaclostridioides mangenotii]|uniref:CopY/TcrY family copper transport repressor n=1 Tax=Metaclostridioides mangenotii TaxID=1540 RepID=UPI000467D91B|nr:CopY/TcrY family copper transport repressor [Clostridioides mangenotii]